MIRSSWRQHGSQTSQLGANMAPRNPILGHDGTKVLELGTRTPPFGANMASICFQHPPNWKQDPPTRAKVAPEPRHLEPTRPQDAPKIPQVGTKIPKTRAKVAPKSYKSKKKEGVGAWLKVANNDKHIKSYEPNKIKWKQCKITWKPCKSYENHVESYENHIKPNKTCIKSYETHIKW